MAETTTEKELTVTIDGKAEVYRLPPTGPYGDRARELVEQPSGQVLCHCDGTCAQVAGCLATTLAIMRDPPNYFFSGPKSEMDKTSNNWAARKECAEHYLKHGPKNG